MRLSCNYVHSCTISVCLIETIRRLKQKAVRKAPSAEPELPADLADIMRPDGDDIEGDEVASYVNDTIAQFFEDRQYYYDISHEGSMIAFTHESHSNVHMRSLPIYYRGPRGGGGGGVLPVLLFP